MPDVDIKTSSLADLVRMAWSEKQDLDLEGIGYGRIHWGDQKAVRTQPFSYYYLLAGMIRITRARRVIEIGTHEGGSTRAMARGLTAPTESKIVTFDVTSVGVKRLRDHPTIEAYTVDANSQEAIDICLKQFGGPYVDLVFIDCEHRFSSTLGIFCLYTTIFSPDFVILDDITLNEEMQHFWGIIRHRYGEQNAIDCTDVIPEIRPQGATRPGFGLIRPAVT